MKYAFQLIICVCLVLIGCSEDRLKVDVSDINIDLTVERFEKEMFSGGSPSEMKKINADLITRGAELYEFYIYDMVRSGSVYNDSIGEYLYYFVSDSMMQLVYDDINAEFPDLEKEKETFTSIFKHLKYHLPDAPQPAKIITYNSAYTYGVVSTDSLIGVGLDMYLGEENRIIKQIRFPVYMKEKMNRDYLPVDVAHSWLITNVFKETRGETFLSDLIYFGKLRYALEALLPDLPKHQIMRYSKEELDFALASEYNIWQYLVDMNWIYTTDVKVKLRYFEEAPTTVGIDGSPGRIGQFVGWQMVRNYMIDHPEVTLQQLLNETSETKILKSYKPDANE